MRALKPSFRVVGDEKKHYIRTNLWLPCCKRQLAHVRSESRVPTRPLRYLTFCGEEAVDVLFLEEQGILTVRDGSYADVAFAAQNDEYVTQTLRTIPNAHGFSGDFFETVLFDPATQPDLPAVRTKDPDDAFFAALENAVDSPVGRKQLNIAALRDKLADQFPFDVINLDLCGYTFREPEDIPGRTILALRRILEWQRKSRIEGLRYGVDEFCFLYTTRIDVNDALGRAYERLLDHGIDANVSAFSDLREELVSRFGVTRGSDLRKADLGGYLRLAIPKQLTTTLAAEGWEIDPTYGIECLDLPRSKRGRRYSMLHMGMRLLRKNGAGATSPRVSRRRGSAYHQIVRQLFASPIANVPLGIPKEVAASLSRLLARGEEQRAKSA